MTPPTRCARLRPLRSTGRAPAPRSSRIRSPSRPSSRSPRSANGYRASPPRSVPSRGPGWSCARSARTRTDRLVWDNDRVPEPSAAGPPLTQPTDVTPLGHDVFQIDTRMAGYDGITDGYLIRGDRPCLVETGTAPSAPIVRDALASLGIGPGDLATVVVTHIHLDHAGGAGDIATMYPGAQ